MFNNIYLDTKIKFLSNNLEIFNMKKLMLFFMLSFISFPVFAAEKAVTGKVQLFAYRNLQLVIVEFDKSNAGCGKNYWFDPTTDMGKVLLSMLLTAQMAGKKVWANGVSECLSEYPYNNAYKLTNIKLMSD